jgi:hypothetical protein
MNEATLDGTVMSRWPDIADCWGWRFGMAILLSEMKEAEPRRSASFILILRT